MAGAQRVHGGVHATLCTSHWWVGGYLGAGGGVHSVHAAPAQRRNCCQRCGSSCAKSRASAPFASATCGQGRAGGGHGRSDWVQVCSAAAPRGLGQPGPTKLVQCTAWAPKIPGLTNVLTRLSVVSSLGRASARAAAGQHSASCPTGSPASSPGDHGTSPYLPVGAWSTPAWAPALASTQPQHTQQHRRPTDL